MRDALRWLLILLVCLGMTALCLWWFDVGGLWGLVGAGAGFLLGLQGEHASWGERLGTGYVGALMGLVIGLLGGAFAILAWPHLWAPIERALGL